MIFPKTPPGIERDDTKHGVNYYTRDQLRKYGLQCVEEYLRCHPEMDRSERTNPLKSATPRSADVEFLKGMMGMK